MSHLYLNILFIVSNVILCHSAAINGSNNKMITGIFETNIAMLSRFENDSLCCSCGRQCIAKCCPYGSVLSGQKKCVNESETLLFLNDLKKNNILGQANSYQLLEGFPDCSNGRYILHIDEDQFNIAESGSLVIQQCNVHINIRNYCLEYYLPANHTISLACFQQSAGQTAITSAYFPIGMLISSAFLTATFIIYAIVPELCNVHGLCLMCHVISLAIGYILLSITKFGITVVEDVLCVPLAYAVMLTFQASFFWLNAMCFDIWWGLRKMTATMAESSKNIHKKKFLFYSLYSWGLPVILIFIVFLMEQDIIPQVVVKPEFGVEKCWFRTEKAALYYLYLPLTFILVSNLMFFILTVRIVFKQLRETDKVLKKGESKRHQDNERKRFILYSKLFIVMGINWTTELVSFLLNYREETNQNCDDKEEEEASVWKVTDLSNILQGVLIFFIFVWKRKVLHLLTAKYCPTMVHKNNTTSSKKESCDSNAIQRTTVTSISSNIEMSPEPNNSINKKSI